MTSSGANTEEHRTCNTPAKIHPASRNDRRAAPGGRRDKTCLDLGQHPSLDRPIVNERADPVGVQLADDATILPAYARDIGHEDEQSRGEARGASAAGSLPGHLAVAPQFLAPGRTRGPPKPALMPPTT